MQRLTVFFLSLLTTSVYGQDVIRVQNGASFSIQNDLEVTVSGGITLEDGSTLVNNGIFRLIRNDVAGAADFMDNTRTAYSYGAGRVIFNSTQNQNTTSKNIFEQIDVDCGGLTLFSTISANKWLLAKGIIKTSTAFFAIALSDARLAIEASSANPQFTNSWFNGNLRRYVTPAVVNAYLFPVGNSLNPNIAELTNLTASPLNNLTYINALFGTKNGTDAGLNASEDGITYQTVNNGGVWYLTPNILPSSGKYDLRLYFNGFFGLSDNFFGILRRPDASSNGADWSVPAGSLLNPANGIGRLVAHGYARRNNISGFSQFGIGQNAANAPLPVKLLYLQGHNITAGNLLKWATSSESNSLHYVVERSDNGSQFYSIGTVNAAGFSVSTQVYNFTDIQPWAGINYYRLRMVDIDGGFEYSYVIVLRNGAQQNEFKLVPNPVQAGHNAGVLLTGTVTGNVWIKLMNENGQILHTQTVNGAGGVYKTEIPTGSLRSGMYIVTCYSKNEQIGIGKLIVVQ